MDVDDGDDIVETPEEDDEAEPGLFSVSKLKESTNNSSEWLMKEWCSPIYIFFKQTPCIEYVEDRRAHVFMCAAGHCKGKNGRGVQHFLNKGDRKSTSNLRKHAKICWGLEAVEAADNTCDVDAARKILSKTKLQDGSITTEFKRIGKGKVTFSIRQHTTAEAR